MENYNIIFERFSQTAPSLVIKEVLPYYKTPRVVGTARINYDTTGKPSVAIHSLHSNYITINDCLKKAASIF